MNNEKMNQMIELAWKKYADSHYIPGNPNGKLLSEQLVGLRPMMHNRETFRKEIIKNPSFASQWGLKIEERELSLEEKEYQLEKTNCINDIENDRIIYGHEWEKYIQEQYEGIQLTQGIKIPTKLITITYNNEKIEIYE